MCDAQLFELLDRFTDLIFPKSDVFCSLGSGRLTLVDATLVVIEEVHHAVDVFETEVTGVVSERECVFGVFGGGVDLGLAQGSTCTFLEF